MLFGGDSASTDCAGSTAFSEKREILQNLKQYISQHSDVIVRALVQENGKTELEGLSQEVIPVLDTIEFLEKNAEKILSPQVQKLKTRQFYFRGKEGRRESYHS